MRFFLLKENSGSSGGSNGNANANGNGNGSDSSSAPLAIGSRSSPRRVRPFIFLLLTILALIGLIANLALLFASVDHFISLLRQHCKNNDQKGGPSTAAETDKEKQQNSTLKLPRVRISSAEIRPQFNHERENASFSPFSSLERSQPAVMKMTAKGQAGVNGTRQGSQESIGTTHSPPPPPLHLSIQRTTLFIGKSAAQLLKETSTMPSIGRPTILPRLRLTAADLMGRPKSPMGHRKSTTIIPISAPAIRPTKTPTIMDVPKRVTPAKSIFAIGQWSSPSTPTVVTALLDIGRDRWSQYGRTMQQYHKFMRNLLQLRVPMVVMVDEKSVEFVHRERARIGWGAQTKVQQISLSQLPSFAFQSQVSRIMGAELANWPSEWDSAMATHPEASHPEYVLLVNSKSFFLAQVAANNPFGTEFFVWLDAGYGHGERSVFPASWQWRPTFPRGKISLIKLTPPSDPFNRYGLHQLYRQDVSVFSGGFVAGDRASVTRLHQLYYRKFVALLERHKVDDDQTMLVLLANEHPDLFHVSHGDWFDAFELF